MNYRITEDWLADVFGTLFGFFDEEEVRKLEIPAFEDENPAEIAARFYAKRSYEVISEDMEYGSARWGNAQDIKPYMDDDPENNIILTETEGLTMSSRPKQPKYARNKNVVVIGGSG